MNAYKIKMTVRGRVQGVGFRYTTLQAAKELGIKGQVWNNPDGTVGILAQEMDRAKVIKFQNQVQLGFSKSPWIRVESVTTQEDLSSPEFSDFQITK